MTRLTADLLLLATAAVWGLAFVFQKSAMAEVGPFTFIAARASLAALALAPLALAESRRIATPIPAAFLRISLFAGFAFLLGAAFQQIGLVTASVTNSGFLTALYVVFTPFIAWAVTRVAPAAIVWPAAAVSFVGTWLLGGGTLSAFSRGDVLVGICAVFWAVHVVITGAAVRHGRPILFTCLQFVVVAVISLAVAVTVETITWDGLVRAAPAIAYVGLLSSALTFTLLSIAVRYTPTSEAAVIISTESLFSALAGALLLGERLPLIAWIGAMLIVAATLAVQLAPHIGGRRRPRDVAGA